MIKKAPLIRALKQVANEYNSNSHKLEMSTCPICKLYSDNLAYDCGNCPMRIAFKACGRRQCSPLHCFINGERKLTNKDHLNKLEAVKEFYFKTIARVRRMTIKELNEPYAFNFMYGIDRSVAEKYGITKEETPWEN